MNQPDSAVLSQGPVHHRRIADGVIVWPHDSEPCVLQGLTADAWLELRTPMDRPQLHRILMAKYNAGDPTKLREAIDDALRMLRGYLISEGPSSNGGSDTRPDDPSQDAAQSTASSSITGLAEYSDVPSRSARAVLAVIQSTIGIEISGGTPITASWDAAAHCNRERILPGLVAALRDGACEAPDDLKSHVRALDETEQLHHLRCERLLLDVVEDLAELGIEYRVLKGLATAHLDYPSPELRRFGDVDLFVRLQDQTAAIARLKERGFRHIVGGDPGPLGLYKSSYLISPDDVELDLHHRLFRHGQSHTELIWNEVEDFVVAGRDLHAFSGPIRLLHASAHAVFSRGDTARLSRFLDAARLMVNDPEAAHETLAFANKMHLGGTIKMGIERSLEVAGLSAIGVPNSADGFELRDRVARWAFDGQERRVLREQLSLILGLSPIDSMRWQWAWVRPSPSYTGPTVRDRIRSLARSRSKSP